MHTARLRLDCGDAATCQAVADALAPEIPDAPPGVTASARPERDALIVELQADDLAGLRAAVNGLVRLADAAARALPADGNR